jgi:phosphoglycerol transferase
LAEASLVFTILFIFLAGWRRDFRVPLSFTRDALEYLMQVKGTIENGWWWVHPRLSAPGVFEEIQYPSNTNVDQAIVWIVHLFTGEPGLAINVSWMIMVVLSALIASRCLRLLGLSRRIAIPVGLLFALSPYALYRNIDHFSLAIYLVPIPSTVALLVATGRLGELQRRRRWALMALCALVGFNYTYYAFFACFLILIASLIAWNRRELRGGLTFVAVICLATAVNLAPSLYAWGEDGRPLSIPEKHAAEAEQYGLKIRTLVSPILEHAFLPFRYWTEIEEDAEYPLENENKESRLSIIGSLGFVALLCGLFVPKIASALSDGPLFTAAGRLTLSAVLLATVGGFGSLFNLLVSPEIRAYNRITPFISFFSLCAIALIAERVLAGFAASKIRSWMPVALIAALFIGLYDESQAARPLNRDYNGIRHEWTALGAFVRSLEDRLPDGAMVFQLPELTYLNEIGHEKMQPLDHIKPYLPSTRVHWSYPALSDSVVLWQQQVGRLPTPMLATALVAQGFNTVLIDRNGYFDRAQALLTELGVAASSKAVIVESDRYIALDLSFVRKADIPPDRLPRLGAKATAATAGLRDCGTTTAYNLEWIGGSAAPFARTPVRVSLSGEFFVAGWAVDDPHQTVAGDVDVVVGDTAYSAFYPVDRPDVAKYLGVSTYRASGFIVRLDGENVGSGVRTLSLRILAADRRCYYQTPAIPIVAH